MRVTETRFNDLKEKITYTGLTEKQLSKRFKVSPATIQRIKAAKSFDQYKINTRKRMARESRNQLTFIGWLKKLWA